ncbi:MAG: hypothetical protein QXT73_01145 [Candidatus Methanomethylicaceae archaeon]
MILKDVYDVEDTLTIKGKQDYDPSMLEELKERLAKWKTFRSTREGSLVYELSDSYIRNLQFNLSRPVSSFGNIPLDKIQEMRAEWRGELRVWWMLRYYPDLLEKELESCKKVLGKELTEQ